MPWPRSSRSRPSPFLFHLRLALPDPDLERSQIRRSTDPDPRMCDPMSERITAEKAWPCKVSTSSSQKLGARRFAPRAPRAAIPSPQGRFPPSPALLLRSHDPTGADGALFRASAWPSFSAAPGFRAGPTAERVGFPPGTFSRAHGVSPATLLPPCAQRVRLRSADMDSGGLPRRSPPAARGRLSCDMPKCQATMQSADAITEGWPLRVEGRRGTGHYHRDGLSQYARLGGARQAAPVTRVSGGCAESGPPAGYSQSEAVRARSWCSRQSAC
jgi:hypothetical protein